MSKVNINFSYHSDREKCEGDADLGSIGLGLSLVPS